MQQLKWIRGLIQACVVAICLIVLQNGLLFSPTPLQAAQAPNLSFDSVKTSALVALNPTIPGGGLSAHEAIGGHTIDRHIGKTEQQLRQRLAAEPQISAASSFYNQQQAERDIGEALAVNQGVIATWLKSPERRYTFNYDTKHPVGITISRNRPQAITVSKLRVVLQRKSNFPPGYFILTAYPTT